MAAEDPFLSRWSRRKIDARQGRSLEEPLPPPAVIAPGVAGSGNPAIPTPAPDEPLPPVESLTHESDFTPFMKTDVDEAVKNQALRTLFSDPHFNVMDGLDTYIADFSQPDPLPPDWLGKMNQMARLGAFQEKEPEAGPEGLPGTVPEALEAPVPQSGEALVADAKSELEQQVEKPPSGDTSVTPDSGIEPPAVRQ